MVSESYRFWTAVRVALIAAVILVSGYLYFNTDLHITLLFLTGLLVFQVWDLLHYIDRSNRDVTRFLDALRFGDFSQTFAIARSSGSHRELRLALNEVMKEFGRARRSGAEKHQYLQAVVGHAGIGLMAIRSDGEIELSNTLACRLLGVHRLGHLSELPDSLNNLAEAIQSIRSGERVVVKTVRDRMPIQLSLSATEFRQDTREIKLLSIQDISRELAHHEMEAWQRLAQVLSHEIMNSVTPISSLSTTAHKLLANTLSDNRQPDADFNRKLQDVQEAIVTIEKRSSGLIQFVQAYRDLTRIAKPQIKIVRVSELLARVKQLIKARDEAHNVTIHTVVDPKNLEITVDPTQIEQVLLNLAVNAIQSLTGHAEGVIGLTGRLGDSGRPIIEVIDNGPGIDPEAMDKLFVPFFSTKPDGTGIGLALSRQIMRMHKGEIEVASVPDKETVFTLRF